MAQENTTAAIARRLPSARTVAAAIEPAAPLLNAALPSPDDALPLNLAKAEDALIQRALQETGGNIADAARLLGVHRTRIYRKLAQEAPA